MLVFLLYLGFILALFISFFILYILSKNDFVLVRQNVSLTEIFNLGISGVIIAGIISRIFYIFDTNSWNLLNPLSFFHIFKTEGLSLFGFYITLALWIYLRLKKQKALPRVFDIFALSFSPVFLSSFLVPYLSKMYYFIEIGVFVICLIFIIFLFRINKNYKLKDGSVTFLIFFLVSVQNFVLEVLFGKNLSISPSFYLSFITLFLSLGFFVYNQNLLFFKKRK